MAYVKKTINKDTWTLIASNVTAVTFQNASQFPLYVNFTSSADISPSDAYGLVYGPWQGELKKNIVEMTNVATPSHVWAKNISFNGSVIVEE